MRLFGKLLTETIKITSGSAVGLLTIAHAKKEQEKAAQWFKFLPPAEQKEMVEIGKGMRNSYRF